MKAKLEALKNQEKSDKKKNKEEENNKKELNEYEEQFAIMLRENLIEYLAAEEIELADIDVENMTEEEREGEKIFYSNTSKNLLAKVFKDASKRKIRKLKTSTLENNEPSIFIQTITKKYDKEYIIYLQANGDYEHTIKNKRYRVNNTNLKGVSGRLSVHLLIFEKNEGKMIYLTDHRLAGYTTDSTTRMKSGASIYDKLFEKFGKKMARKVKKAIE